MQTNKIYVWNPINGTVSIIDSNTGTVKNIRLGIDSLKGDFGSIAVDYMNNRIYVTNEDSTCNF